MRVLLGEQHGRMVMGLTPSHSAAKTVYGDLGQGILAIAVTLLALVTLLVVVAYLEPRKPTPPRTRVESPRGGGRRGA